jgi:hypothetical protein
MGVAAIADVIVAVMADVVGFAAADEDAVGVVSVDVGFGHPDSSATPTTRLRVDFMARR